MNIFAISITTVEKRIYMAKRLARQLEHSGHSCVIYKDCSNDLKRNMEIAWRDAFSRNSRWAGVIQDDAILCSNFDIRLTDVLVDADSKGYEVVSLMNLNKDGMSNFGDFVVVKGKNFSCEVAVFMKHDLQQLYVEYIQRKNVSVNHDLILATMFDEYGLDVYSPWPNIVDHNSIIGRAQHRGKKYNGRLLASRRSINFKM